MALRSPVPQYQYRGHRLVTGPAVEPVTADELRAFVRADAGTMSNSEAELFITQAREFIENMSGLALIDQTWRLSLDNWPGYIEPWWDGVRQMAISELTTGRPREVYFPRYPLSSVTSVKTYDEASNVTNVNVSATFDLDTQSLPGRLALKFGQVWPTALRPTNAIEIEYVAGFGDQLTDVPAGLRSAVLSLAGYYYEHRGECDMQMAYQKSGAYESVMAYAVRKI